MSGATRRDAAGGHGRPDGGSSLVRGVLRVSRAWRVLASEQRLAAAAALGLFLSMLLPWYVKTFVVASTKSGQVQPSNLTASHDLTAFGSFSFVEAAVLLVAGSILVLLFARGEGKAFHLPGGDGPVITLAGVWAGVLIFYRMLDTPHTSHAGPTVVTDVGLKWGIFFALAAAIGLAFAGYRVRAAHRPEPPLPVGGPDSGGVPLRARAANDDGGHPRPGTVVTPPLPPSSPPTAVTERMAGERRSADEPDAPTEQLSFDVAPSPAGAEREARRSRTDPRDPSRPRPSR